MNLFDIKPVEGKLLKNIRNIIKNKLNKKVVSGIKICRKNKVKACKIIIENDDPLRLDINYHQPTTRLQMIANKTDIEIPKVIFIEGQYKFSEWIEGVMIRDVWDVNEVLIKSGDLIGRLNLIKNPVNNHFLTNSEFSGTNAVWTKDKKVYIVDHGRMKSQLNPDDSVVALLLKRIQKKERINLFLKGYSKYRDITNIIKSLDEKNWQWPQWVKRGKYKND
jgi:hypothetical protein